MDASAIDPIRRFRRRPRPEEKERGPARQNRRRADAQPCLFASWWVTCRLSGSVQRYLSKNCVCDETHRCRAPTDANDLPIT